MAAIIVPRHQPLSSRNRGEMGSPESKFPKVTELRSRQMRKGYSVRQAGSKSRFSSLVSRHRKRFGLMARIKALRLVGRMNVDDDDTVPLGDVCV